MQRVETLRTPGRGAAARRRSPGSAILKAIDEERERLARELHDGLCQSLAGILALGVSLSKKLPAREQAVASRESDEIVRLVREVIDETRNMARGLGPAGLIESGLDGALAHLAMATQRRLGVACTLECSPPFPALQVESGIHVFRIAQESINNAVTHGHAARIELSLLRHGRQGRISIRDDGLGISDKTLHSGGSGLRTMSYRARLIGGRLEVRRHPERGTVVTCTFPMKLRTANSRRVRSGS